MGTKKATRKAPPKAGNAKPPPARREISIYDALLRDGTQGEEINFSVEDKLRITEKLDEMGVDYIEGGYPGSNPKDLEFFRAAKSLRLSHAKLVAFGATRRSGTSCEKDAGMQGLLRAETPVATIFGKSWDLHVTDALRIPLQENLDIIHDSLRWLTKRFDRVIYDAEHFFDGYKRNQAYALKSLTAAVEAGPDWIVLCDTNGGSMPHEVAEIVEAVRARFDVPLGIHCHNDCELGVANTLAAVAKGADQVQGTINGFGERCGNANLTSIIPNLQFKLGLRCISDGQISKLVELSHFVDELANVPPNNRAAFVGRSAFAHKGGMHVDAVQKNPETYEHIHPELVGNRQRILVSDMAGKGNVLAKAREVGIDLESGDPVAREILAQVKQLEHEGYAFEGADASFEILLRKSMGTHKKYFSLHGFRVIDEKRDENVTPISEATVQVEVGGHLEHTAAVGNGPVNALDNALRKALENFYPSLMKMELLDYKVRVLASGHGTGARVRVLIESGDHSSRWGTVGVSENIIEASWRALVDSVEFKLMKDERAARASKRKPRS
ncbi:MAG: citramalate synthase [Deltaproteobacteria bacterium]|nr:citramalate synthase [Deltaproteobacteria bacterium]